MTFIEIVAEVLKITARPDRESEIRSAVNTVLSRCILKTTFARDLVETTIAIDASAYGATIDISSHVTRFRKMKYVKLYGVQGYLHAIDSDKIFTPGNNIQRDRYYLAGLNMTYTLSSLGPTLEIGYYQYAAIQDELSTPDHWMFEMAPWAIIDLAAARIFRSIGDDVSGARYEKSGIEFYDIAKRDFADSILPEAR